MTTTIRSAAPAALGPTAPPPPDRHRRPAGPRPPGRHGGPRRPGAPPAAPGPEREGQMQDLIAQGQRVRGPAPPERRRRPVAVGPRQRERPGNPHHARPQRAGPGVPGHPQPHPQGQRVRGPAPVGRRWRQGPGAPGHARLRLPRIPTPRTPHTNRCHHTRPVGLSAGGAFPLSGSVAGRGCSLRGQVAAGPGGGAGATR